MSHYDAVMRPTGSPPPEDPEPWEERSSEEYGVTAARTIRYRRQPADRPTELIFSGPCPRCQDPFSYEWPLVNVRGGDNSGVTVYCQCKTNHPGRPDKVDGCGAYWKVQVPLP